MGASIQWQRATSAAVRLSCLILPSCWRTEYPAHTRQDAMPIVKELNRFARHLVMHHMAKGKKAEDIYCTLASILIEQDVEKARETLIDLDKRLSTKK
jgi:hypothetical protein